MFDRKSFKRVFDFNDKEVDEFLEVVAGEEMDDKSSDNKK